MGGRQHIVDLLVTLAETYPEREVYIKLRHLPSENNGHVHREMFPYSDLLPLNTPSNLKVLAGSMQESISLAGIAITCTSTAAVETISAGIPTCIYTKYVDYLLDPLSASMARLFQDSGLVADLTDLLELKVNTPNRRWLDANFRGPELFDEMIEAIKNFHR